MWGVHQKMVLGGATSRGWYLNLYKNIITIDYIIRLKILHLEISLPKGLFLAHKIFNCNFLNLTET